MPEEISATREREAIGGWLLLVCIVLVPHILNSPLILAKSLPFLRDAGVGLDMRVEALRLVTLVVVFLGNSCGLLLILTRHRFTPAYFTFYVPLLVGLFLLDPDPGLTARSYAQRLGVTYPNAPGSFVVHVTIALAASALFFGYWLRSERVRRTFGSNGIEILRHRAGNP